MIQDREPLEADAPRSASTLGADPVGWRFNVDGHVSIIAGCGVVSTARAR